MNLGIAATTFAVVIPAELPDKTFVSTVLLGSRHRAAPVWCGAAAALVLQAGIAAAAGRLVALLPHRAVDGVVAALFLAGAAYMLLGSSPSQVTSGTELADAARGTATGAAGPPTRASWKRLAEGSSSVRIATTTFAVVALAELGDLTQVVVANLSARDGDAASVFVGASVAFVLLSGIGVLAGRSIARVVPLALVRRISGAVLAALGVWSALGAAGG